MGAYIYDPVEKKLVPLVSNDDHLTDEMIAGYEASNLAANAYNVGEQLIYNGKLYTVTSPIAIGDDITNKIAESESLSKQLLGYEKKIWKGTEEEWEALSAAEKANYTTAIITNDTINSPVEFQGATENTNGTKGLVKQPLAGDQNKVLYGDGSWKRINNDISNLAPAYDPSLTYEVGELVTYIDAQGSGKLYKCIVPVTTLEAFDINKWDDVTTSIVFKTVDKTATFTTTAGSTTMSEFFDTLNSLIAAIDDFSDIWLERINTVTGDIAHFRFIGTMSGGYYEFHNVGETGQILNNVIILCNPDKPANSAIKHYTLNFSNSTFEYSIENYSNSPYSTANTYTFTLHY